MTGKEEMALPQGRDGGVGGGKPELGLMDVEAVGYVILHAL